ncbi:MAG TPA: hypothetical protein VJT31_30485 [Rugosimonospora sp.]|nr:hypothetical protein [Rugosimonospora sp.]
MSLSPSVLLLLIIAASLGGAGWLLHAAPHPPPRVPPSTDAPAPGEPDRSPPTAPPDALVPRQRCNPSAATRITRRDQGRPPYPGSPRDDLRGGTGTDNQPPSAGPAVDG